MDIEHRVGKKTCWELVFRCSIHKGKHESKEGTGITCWRVALDVHVQHYTQNNVA